MSIRNWLTQHIRTPNQPPRAKAKASASQNISIKSSAAGPFIAWSNIGRPKWTSRRYDSLAENGYRKNVVAYRCISMIANSAASVPWLLYNNRGQELETHPLLSLMQRPNPMQDSVSFLQSLFINLEISGNAYVEAVFPSENGAPVELYSLRPDRMKVVPGPTGLPQGYEYQVNGQTMRWSADPISGESAILHIKNYHPLDDWYGLAPLEAALLSVDQHNAAGVWNQALLTHSARPSGALVFAPKEGPSNLTDDQMRRLREEMESHYQGATESGRPLILEGGLQWQEMSLTPKDMDWLSGRDAAARDIALAFGVPAQLVGIPGSQTYANMAEARLAFYEETILPKLRHVLAAFENWLTPHYEDDLQLDFDMDEISALQPRREDLWARLQNCNFLTLNEKRAALGYGPLPEQDSLPTSEAKI